MPFRVRAWLVSLSERLVLPRQVAIADLGRPSVVFTRVALAALVLLSIALACVPYFRFLAAAGATNLLLVTFPIPPIAVLLGAAGIASPGRDGPDRLAAIGGLIARGPYARRNSGPAAQLRLLAGLVRVRPNPQIELKE